MKIRMIN